MSAQALPSGPGQPWYAAVYLADHNFEIVVPGYAPGLTGVQPYQVKVGRWLGPRWALEVGYSAYHFVDKRTAYGTTATGEPTSRYSSSEDWATALPVLLRRRLTHQAAHRFQFDGLAGLTVVQYRDQLAVIEQTNGHVVREQAWGSRATNSYLTLGPAASYLFGQHVEATVEASLTKNLRTIDRTFSTQQLNGTLGFQRGWNVGLRYRFDVKRKAGASNAL
ncbi:hypothetical protein AUC43_12950 [Hymenobacter sedentarius]|uniref:Outer membrane protein beta-barrel domain-containing protein n=1 Tax=Hymenobacter sedentarius TaxID=1411621 RepID=A0A0U3SIJ8_9BACT|nr:hypothetical protein AUC43_12950 [Hymenobacter sedentarius]